MSKRNFESGASKRKRKAEEEEFHSKQRGAILNFVTRQPRSPPHSAASTSETQIQNEEDTQSSSQSLTSGQSSQMASEEVCRRS